MENLSPTAFKISGRVLGAFDSQLNWLQNFGSRILNFRPKNFYSSPKSIFFQKFSLNLGGGAKKIWGKNSKFCPKRFVAILVVRRISQIASLYLENCKRRQIYRETATAKMQNRNINCGNFLEKN